MSILSDAANRMRISSIEMTTEAKSGHPTSACSAAEIMAVLFFDEMRYSIEAPKDPSADRFVMSKGHACPVLYAAWHEAGLLSRDQIMSLRKIDSDIEGHPTPRLNFIDVATGSLGQGLSMAAGMAYTGKHFDKASYRTYCLIGDGESAEGSIWEAAAFASHYQLDNLVAIIDVNRLGQSEATALGHHTDVYARRMEAFGWHAIVVDGHDIAALQTAFATAKATKGKPTAIIAKTLKGRGIEGVEDLDNWHGKPVGDKGIAEIKARISKDSSKVTIKSLPGDVPMYKRAAPALPKAPEWKLGEKMATRQAYGIALASLGEQSSQVISLDGDTKNSTFALTFKTAHPERFIECFIAEQNLVGVAVGCATRNRTIPFCSTFGAFFTRAADQLRMAAVSMVDVKCVGSHVGVSIGEDGPSQMALEDLALFRSLVGSTVFYPSDAVSCARAVELAANTPGVCYIRTSRPAMPTLYNGAKEVFEVGRAKILRESSEDKCLVIGAGVTLLEALSAADTLASEGVKVCVLDPFTIKPIDTEAIAKHARRCGGNVVVVEDHYYQGGLGDAIMSAMLTNKDVAYNFKHMAVGSLPRSGPPADLIKMFGIDAGSIVNTVKQIVTGKPHRMTSTTTAAIVVIGDEILKGQTRDVNSSYIARRLFERGVKLTTIRTIGDSQNDISSTIKELHKSHDHIFTCGGIGPTHDDITFESVAYALNDLCKLDDTLAKIVTKFFPTDKTETALRLAMIPSRSTLLWGGPKFKSKYPVVSVENVVMLPGVPSLCRTATDIAISSLMGDVSTSPRRQHVIYSTGDEFSIADTVTSVANEYKGRGVNIGSYPDLHHAYYKVRLTADAPDDQVAIEAIDALRLSLKGACFVNDAVHKADHIITYDEHVEVNAHDKLARHVEGVEEGAYRQRLQEATGVIRETLEEHDPSQICVSFNGGKDCTALLYLVHAAIDGMPKFKDFKLPIVYFPSDDTFDEVEKFITQATTMYNCDLMTYPGRPKDALIKLCSDHPSLKVVLMGGRSTDPGHSTLAMRQETDPGWPPLLRVNPLLHFEYADIWRLLRSLYIPYCELYEHGYTSIGCRGRTKPNEELAYTDGLGRRRYRAAHTLKHAHSERNGR